jgi:lambda repressor-like predicted transcriptional regulator
MRLVLQAHSEGSSLRGISRITGLAYETVVSVIAAASRKAQMIHNHELNAVETESIGADEFWSFVEKSRNTATTTNRM